MDLDERVVEGIKYLDNIHPGWYSRIDLDRLHMNHSEQCVLGQISGSFWRYINENFLGEDWAIAHGFTLPAGEFSDDGWELLASLWVEEVIVRSDTTSET